MRVKYICKKVESVTFFLISWPLILDDYKMFTSKSMDRMLLMNYAFIHLPMSIFK